MRAAAPPRFVIPVTTIPSAWRLVATSVLASTIALGVRHYTVANDESRWLVVAADSGITVAVDTSRIEREYGHAFRVWSRTDHDATRFYEDKAFNRETVQAIVRCDGYSFRVVSSEMSMRGGATVVRQVNANGELSRQPWRTVEAGSIDARAALAVCTLIDRPFTSATR